MKMKVSFPTIFFGLNCFSSTNFRSQFVQISLTNVTSLFYHWNRARGTSPISSFTWRLEKITWKHTGSFTESWTSNKPPHSPTHTLGAKGSCLGSTNSAVPEERLRAKLCFHSHPLSLLKGADTDLSTHALISPQSCNLHGIWPLFAKRGGAVRRKRPTKTVLQNIHFSVVMQKSLFVL